MGIIIGIDFGTKRIGLAHTDPMHIIASGLATVERSKAIQYLKDYAFTSPIEHLVVGEPKKLDDSPSESVPALNQFIAELKKAFPTTPISFVDERFTSKMAFQTMIDSGLKKKARQNKALIDEISATIILQSYLEQKI